MKKKIITICSSMSFYKDVVNIENELKKLGFAVKIPATALKMKKSGDFNDKDKRPWLADKTQYKQKTKLMNEHFKKVQEADAILVVNNEKHGIDGYIGEIG